MFAPEGVAASLFDTLGSTNVTAKQWVSDGFDASVPHWVLAKSQTAGRGRLGRDWATNSGNFAGSLIIKVRAFERVLNFLPLAIGLAVRQTIASYLADPSRVLVKWPNDVLVDGAKISGILMERTDGPGGDCLVIGIGINLSSAPSETLFQATSLKALGVSVPAVSSFFEKLSSEVAAVLDRLQNTAPSTLLSEWRSFAYGIGERRPVTLDKEKVFATLLHLNDDASLSVRLDDGQIIRLYAGDIG